MAPEAETTSFSECSGQAAYPPDVPLFWLSARTPELRATSQVPLVCPRAASTAACVLVCDLVHQLESGSQQAQKEMADTLAVVAHELRNPLGPIDTVAELLCRVRPEELPRLQAIIQRQVKRMASLIADLIEVARADAGKLTLRREVVDMRVIAAEAVDSCRAAMSARAQRLEIDLPSMPLDVDGDPGRLVQIVSNLLDNASKYTPSGGMVGISVATTDDEVRLTVSDSGIGISADALPHLFERYTQEEHAMDFNGGGLGIGLAVVRELVQAHGGAVQAHSAGLGQGSQFVVMLPRLCG